VNDDEHSLFHGVENWLLLRIMCTLFHMWNKTPESIFQIPRGQWGTQ